MISLLNTELNTCDKHGVTLVVSEDLQYPIGCVYCELDRLKRVEEPGQLGRFTSRKSNVNWDDDNLEVEAECYEPGAEAEGLSELDAMLLSSFDEQQKHREKIELLKRIIETVEGSMEHCPFCGTCESYPEHLDNCPIAQARKLVGDRYDGKLRHETPSDDCDSGVFGVPEKCVCFPCRGIILEDRVRGLFVCSSCDRSYGPLTEFDPFDAL